MDAAIFWMRNTVSVRNSVRYAVFRLQRGCGKVEFKRTVTGFSLASWRRVVCSFPCTLLFTG